MGVVLYIMLSGKVPFPGRTEPEIIYNVIKGEFHFDYSAFKTISEECKNFIRRCLVREYEKRYSATEAIQDPWIQKNANDSAINHLTEGTIGNYGVSQQVLSDIDLVIKQAEIKNAAL
jgi:calcium-dependent protein kinase